eukprot:TRINITY_DN1343_c0_g1_i2.p2 TRINITY_DN1343_c0_g1~~TRINITY_DN1343_c0_g1_i2.p2  ORF type:complete len:112 (+),score=20.18 TRINITY_DN1343_c0_g1_i2:97-432(+)
MGKVSLFVGGALGAALPAFTNILARQWMLRRPWLHVAFGIAGAYLVDAQDRFLDASTNARRSQIKLINEMYTEADEVKNLRNERLSQADAIVERNGIDITGHASQASSHHH